MENIILKTPFGKAVRLRNFKLWRSKYTVADGKGKVEIECLNVSNLDGSWMTRIPSTSQMYGVIVNSFNTNDDEMRDNFVGMILSNIYNIALNPSEALHDAFFFLHEMMAFPYLLLSEKEMRKRMDKELKESGFDKSKRKDHIGKMVEYRSQLYALIEAKRDRLIENYERQLLERRASEEESLKSIEQDELAEQAMDVLNK